jgi:hypothetical protein
MNEQRLLSRKSGEDSMGDYYQGIVYDYLRADRSVFINTECTIQIEAGDQPPKGKSWICDAIAADFRAKTVFLCEVTYSESLQALLKRLSAWNDHWNEISEALIDEKYNNLPKNWEVMPWLFIPKHLEAKLKQGLGKIKETSGELKFKHKITILENVQPWKYRNWDRIREDEEADRIPIGAQS